MSSFKFDQKEIASKNFYKQMQVTDILMIDVSKIALLKVSFEKVSFNNEKD